MKVEYIDHMGSDLSVVNAARVSFNKESDWNYHLNDAGVELSEPTLPHADAKLIKYLAKHNLWTPFGHTAITLHFKAPIFVARQLGKSQVGMVWNEVSRRYVSDSPEFYTPEVWRKAADNVKQGSSDEPINAEYNPAYLYSSMLAAYHSALEYDVCPEQARMLLPQSMLTEWYWTGNLKSFANVYNLRTDSHTQRETQEVAKQIGEVIGKLFPISFDALTSRI